MKKGNLSRRDFLKKSTGLLSEKLDPGSGESTCTSISSFSPGKFNELNHFAFHNPGPEYRGVPLWFFNDRLEKEDIIRQLKGMRYAGWGRVMPRRYTGGIHPAYGKIWNEAIKTTIDVCKETEMKVILPEIDKNGWYTAAPTNLPGMKDEFRNKCLIQRGKKEKPGKNEQLLTQKGDYSYYQYTSFPKEGWENSFCYLDILDPDVVNSYSKVLFEFFANEFGPELGKTIEAIWIAEPHIMMGQPASANCLPWTPKLPQLFEKEWGYSLIDNLHLLFNDEEGQDYPKVRYHYWRTLSRLMATSYMKITQEWCNKYHLKLTGHLMGEDSFISQLQYSVNVMPLYEYMDIPGIDHLTMNLNWPTGDPFIMTPKQVSSVANQLGKNEVISEMYGCCDEGLTFEDRKRMFQWFGLMGINYRCYHGAFMSLRGRRKREYPPLFNYQQPYWKDNRIVGDFGSRLSYVLRKGNYQADILVIHPIESYFLKGKIAKQLSKVIGEKDRHLIDLSHNLFKIQQSFDYGDETILSEYGKIVNRSIQVGKMSYKVILLPSMDVIRKSTFQLLKDFVHAGGAIISTGTLPGRIDGETSKELDFLAQKVVHLPNEPKALRQGLEKILDSDFQIRTPENKSNDAVWIHQRNLEGSKFFFLINADGENQTEAVIRIKGPGRIESWDLESGEIHLIPQIQENDFLKIQLTFAPGASHLLVLQENEKPISLRSTESASCWKITLENLKVKREDPNSLTLDFCRYKKENGDWSEILPVQGVQEKLNKDKYFGPITLQFEFEVEDKPDNCSVVIEDADKYLISVNGQPTAYLGLPWYRDRSFLPVRITDLIQKGRNRIEISRDFQSAENKVLGIEELNRFYGTELEQIYLIGDFGVKGQMKGQDKFETTRFIFNPHFSLVEEKGKTTGNLLTDGYCFFNGTINLFSDFNVKEVNPEERVFLEIDQLESVVTKVSINNKEVGHLSWKPYRMEITDFVWKGENTLKLSLTNSLRNLLGEMHFKPLVEDRISSQWSLKVTPKLADGPDWYEKRKNQLLKTWSDDYYFRPFGIFGKVYVTAEKSISSK